MGVSLFKQKTFIYDYLKIISILLVIAGHCFVMYSPDGAIDVVESFFPFQLATLLVYRFHVPCFFMVSGAIFALCLNQNIYPDGITFLKKKALRLLIPYFIFGIFVVPPVLLICELSDPSEWYFFVLNLLTASNVRHLWYLYALFFIFLLMWICRRFLVKNRIKKVLLISFLLSLIFRSFSPAAFALFQIANIFYYQFFFVCGVFLELYFDEILSFLEKKRKFLWFVLAVLLCSMFADFWTLSGYVYALCGMILSLWLALRLSQCKGLSQNKWYQMLGKDSYGVYLIHAMIIYLVFYAFSSVAIPAWILMPLAFFVSLILSVCLTEILRKCGLGFVLGEKRTVRRY